MRDNFSSSVLSSNLLLNSFSVIAICGVGMLLVYVRFNVVYSNKVCFKKYWVI